MDWERWNEMLEQQSDLVYTLQNARLDSLLADDSRTYAYRQATQWFDDEFHRYNWMRIRADAERYTQELDELGDLIRDRFADLRARHREPYQPVFGDFIDVTSDSGSTNEASKPYIDMAFDGEAFVPAYEQPSMSYQSGVFGLPLDEIPALDAERLPALPYGPEESGDRYR